MRTTLGRRLYLPSSTSEAVAARLDKLRAWEERQCAAAGRAARVSLLAMLRFLLAREF